MLLKKILIVLQLINVIYGWKPNGEAKLNIFYDQKISPIFFGNKTEHFRILSYDEETILIGGRNILYNITINGLIENRNERIEWLSSDAHKQLCALKGKTDNDCHNYLRVFVRKSDKQIMLCGTNSFKPLCRYYNQLNTTISSTTTGPTPTTGTPTPTPTTTTDNQNIFTNKYEAINEIEAQGLCPYDPLHNSTYYYTDGQLYSATVADFSGTDSLIYRETQRTEQYDLKQLNQPSFVNILERNGYILFFFREIAIEYMNCGKKVYSRVGRVCKNDKGGPYPFNDRWTSFLKTRLNCSITGEFPFYFDEIQATTKIINRSNDNGTIKSFIYAIFTTPINSIGGSAVCMFDIDDISSAFNGRFKSQRDINSYWLPIPLDRVPEPRPGKCVDDSRTLPSLSVNFVKTHTLMDEVINPMFDEPLLLRVSLEYRFTAIAVDPQVTTLDGNRYDILFIGTSIGTVIKFFSIFHDDKLMKTVVVNEIQAFNNGARINQLVISKKLNTLVVSGDNQIVTIPLYQCKKVLNCNNCVRYQDPYCLWDNQNHECIDLTRINVKNSKNIYIQDVVHGSNDGNCKKFNNQNLNANGGGGNGGGGGYGGGNGGGGGGNLYTGNTVSNTPSIHNGYQNFYQSVTRGTLSSVGKPQLGTESNSPLPSVADINGNGDDTDGNDEFLKEENLLDRDGSDTDLTHSGGGLLITGPSLSWFLIIPAFISLIIGVIIGFLFAVRCNRTAIYQHNNHLNCYGKTRGIIHNQSSSSGGKDINLLMNATQMTSQANNKKDNIDIEFCNALKEQRNNEMMMMKSCSMENLDKEQQQQQQPQQQPQAQQQQQQQCKAVSGVTSGTNIGGGGTLQKVKKTYI